jgi:hypothetical protein
LLRGWRRFSMEKELLHSHKFVISTGANPDFLPRSTGDGHVCGFHYGKPHEDRQGH